MPKKPPKSQKVKSGAAAVRAGDRLFAALTHEEIAQLLDVCFTVMTSDLQAQVLPLLQPDTRQTVEQVLYPYRADGNRRAPESAPVSMAKLAQTWSDAWDAWNGIVDTAAQEEGPYMVQEEHWEPPYFDTTTFVEDLERIAATIRPLIYTAFEEEWYPEVDIAAALHGVTTSCTRPNLTPGSWGVQTSGPPGGCTGSSRVSSIPRKAPRGFKTNWRRG